MGAEKKMAAMAAAASVFLAAAAEVVLGIRLDALVAMSPLLTSIIVSEAGMRERNGRWLIVLTALAVFAVSALKKGLR